MPATATRAGRLVRQQSGAEGFSAFLPARLPPEPPLQFTPELQGLSEAAGRALGRLEGVSASLEPDRLLYMYVRKEALAISLWEKKENADAYSRDTYPALLRGLANIVEGTPQVEAYEVANSTFHKIASKS